MARGERIMMVEEIAEIYYDLGSFTGAGVSSICARYGEDNVYDVVQEIEEGRLDYQSLLFDVPDDIEDRLVKKYGGYSILHRCSFKVASKRIILEVVTFPLREVTTLKFILGKEKYTLFNRAYKDYVERSFWRLSLALLKAEREGLQNATEDLTKALLYAKERDASDVHRIMEALGLKA